MSLWRAARQSLSTLAEQQSRLSSSGFGAHRPVVRDTTWIHRCQAALSTSSQARVRHPLPL